MFSKISNLFINREKEINAILGKEFKRLFALAYEQKKEAENLQLFIRRCSEIPMGQDLRSQLKLKTREFSAIKAVKVCSKLKMTEKEARQAVATAFFKRVIKGNTKRQENRSYYCVGCNAYHLTSKDKI